MLAFCLISTFTPSRLQVNNNKKKTKQNIATVKITPNFCFSLLSGGNCVCKSVGKTNTLTSSTVSGMHMRYSFINMVLIPGEVSFFFFCFF